MDIVNIVLKRLYNRRKLIKLAKKTLKERDRKKSANSKNPTKIGKSINERD